MANVLGVPVETVPLVSQCYWINGFLFSSPSHSFDMLFQKWCAQDSSKRRVPVILCKFWWAFVFIASVNLFMRVAEPQTDTNSDRGVFALSTRNAQMNLQGIMLRCSMITPTSRGCHCSQEHSRCCHDEASNSSHIGQQLGTQSRLGGQYSLEIHLEQKKRWNTC